MLFWDTMRDLLGIARGVWPGAGPARGSQILSADKRGPPFAGLVAGHHDGGLMGGQVRDLGRNRARVGGLVDGTERARERRRLVDQPLVELQPLGLVESDRRRDASAVAVGGHEPALGYRSLRD